LKRKARPEGERPYNLNFFAGAGVLDLGFSKAEFDVVWAKE
jgi:site-specific DNA-cytosine methylase